MPQSVLVTYQVYKNKDELLNNGAQRMVAAAVDAVKARGVARFALSANALDAASCDSAAMRFWISWASCSFASLRAEFASSNSV